MPERVKGKITDKELLDRFGLVTEESLATLLGITVPSLRNRPHDQLPEFTKRSRRRLFWEASVRQFLGQTGR